MAESKGSIREVLVTGLLGYDPSTNSNEVKAMYLSYFINLASSLESYVFWQSDALQPSAARGPLKATRSRLMKRR